jgi:hypothetical protein
MGRQQQTVTRAVQEGPNMAFFRIFSKKVFIVPSFFSVF